MMIPTEIAVSMEQVSGITVECWRLRRILETTTINERSPLRHVVRRLAESLEGMGFQTLDFEGRIYDPGMVLDVIEVRADSTVPTGQTVVHETVEPTVMWRGQVVRPGQVVVKRSPAMSVEPSEAAE
jgi:hypothetical protein